jgi:hypothetical protein
MEEVTLDTDRISALFFALYRNGWSPEEIDALADDGVLDRVREVLGSNGETTVESAAWPLLPEGWTIEAHVFHRRFDWDPGMTLLHYADDQTVVGGISGHDLRKLVAGKPVLNASVLDFLLERPHLIPPSWKAALVHFWGTVYRDPAGHACVRHLRWEDGKWLSGRTWLGGDDVGCFSPAVIFAEPLSEVRPSLC